MLIRLISDFFKIPEKQLEVEKYLSDLLANQTPRYIFLASIYSRAVLDSTKLSKTSPNIYINLDKTSAVTRFVSKSKNHDCPEKISPEILSKLILSYNQFCKLRKINDPENLQNLLEGKQIPSDLTCFLSSDTIIKLALHLIKLLQSNPEQRKLLEKLKPEVKKGFPFKASTPFKTIITCLLDGDNNPDFDLVSYINNEAVRKTKFYRDYQSLLNLIQEMVKEN